MNSALAPIGIALALLAAGCANTQGSTGLAPSYTHTSSWKPTVDDSQPYFPQEWYDESVRNCEHFGRRVASEAEGAGQGAVAGALLGAALSAAMGGFNANVAATTAMTGGIAGEANAESTYRNAIRSCMAKRGFPVLN